MSALRLLILVSAAVALAGCGMGPRQSGGPNAFAANGANPSASGAVIDGLIDSELGKRLNDGDKRMAASAEYRALEYGRTGWPVAWRSRSGAYGEVVPGASYRVNAYDCREYTHTVYVDDKPQAARGTACRQVDGNWRTLT